MYISIFSFGEYIFVVGSRKGEVATIVVVVGSAVEAKSNSEYISCCFEKVEWIYSW